MNKQPPDPLETLRQASQPQRDLIKWLQSQFAAGKLKPGGKVLLLKR